jgi:predicted O-methyltransferase YrrM
MNLREAGIVLRNLSLGGNLDSLLAARDPRRAYYYLAESRFLYKCLFPKGGLPQKNVWEAMGVDEVPVVIYGPAARHWFHPVASYATDLVSMCMLCQILKPRMILEIGTFTGSGALHWAGNAPDAQVYTLDLPPKGTPSLTTTHTDREAVSEREAKPMEFEGRPEAKRIHCLYGDSATFDFSPYLGKAELVFIDGAHSYEYVRNDTLRAGPCCKSGGVIAWHDYGRAGFNSVSRWLHEFARDGKKIYRVPGGSLAYTRV